MMEEHRGRQDEWFWVILEVMEVIPESNQKDWRWSQILKSEQHLLLVQELLEQCCIEQVQRMKTKLTTTCPLTQVVSECELI